MQPAPTTLTESARKFIEYVLALRPRVAAFDCDGTLWSGDSGAGFFYFEIERGLIPPDVAKWVLARYQEYLAGSVDELTICGEMVTIHRGIPEADIRALVAEFFRTKIDPSIFPAMRELTQRLAAQGCELWAVSSTCNWMIEEAVKRFDIPVEHVIAATVAIEDGRATDRLLRVPTDEFKASAIKEIVGHRVQAVFGNSMHDFAMLELALHPFAINPNPDLEAVALARHWTIFKP